VEGDGKTNISEESDGGTKRKVWGRVWSNQELSATQVFCKPT
jgi:hypothetical protein